MLGAQARHMLVDPDVDQMDRDTLPSGHPGTGKHYGRKDGQGLQLQNGLWRDGAALAEQRMNTRGQVA